MSSSVPVKSRGGQTELRMEKTSFSGKNPDYFSPNLHGAKQTMESQKLWLITGMPDATRAISPLVSLGT